jgi:predicted Rossmann fold nucleotide-binding protein DprA/Smf involved in DNA uptake
MANHYGIDTTEDYGPLFAPPRARSTDPAPSHEAAAAVPQFEADHRAQILDALLLGPAGATEIARRCKLGRDQVGKRLCELERRGLVVRDGVVRNLNGKTEGRYRRAAASR